MLVLFVSCISPSHLEAVTLEKGRTSHCSFQAVAITKHSTVLTEVWRE